jgi:hypothetical protein
MKCIIQKGYCIFLKSILKINMKNAVGPQKKISGHIKIPGAEKAPGKQQGRADL